MSTVNVKKSLYPSFCYYLLKQTDLIPNDEKKTLIEEGRKLSTFGSEFSFNGPVAGGPIFTFVYQIPSYLDINKNELDKVLNSLKLFIEEGSLAAFMRNWPEKTEFWDLWYTNSWKNFLLKDVSKNSQKALKVIQYFFQLVDTYWDNYIPIYVDKLEKYNFKKANQSIKSIDAIQKWEEELGLRYPYSKFEIIVCPESSTTASSLGPEKIVLGSVHNQKQLVNSYVHEVGVRTVGLHRLARNNKTKDIFKNDYIGMLKLIETEIALRKKNLLPLLKDDIFIKSMGLENLIEWRIKQNTSSDLISDFANYYKSAKTNKLI
jgi:hypothetical protein